MNDDAKKLFVQNYRAWAYGCASGNSILRAHQVSDGFMRAKDMHDRIFHPQPFDVNIPNATLQTASVTRPA